MRRGFKINSVVHRYLEIKKTMMLDINPIGSRITNLRLIVAFSPPIERCDFIPVCPRWMKIMYTAWKAYLLEVDWYYSPQNYASSRIFKVAVRKYHPRPRHPSGAISAIILRGLPTLEIIVRKSRRLSS